VGREGRCPPEASVLRGALQALARDETQAADRSVSRLLLCAISGSRGFSGAWRAPAQLSHCDTWEVARVRQVLARVFVDSLDDALPLYERLADDAPVHRFGFRGIELAQVGPFLLLAGHPQALEPYRNRVASVLVQDVDDIGRLVVEAGGELLEGPMAGPNGARVIARHPDGAIFEYLEAAF
jgi:hypothetical protein